MRDETAVRAACKRLSLPPPVRGTVKLFDGANVTGLQITLPGWLYPVVCDTATGKVNYDNFRGHWGEQKHLDGFMQAYAVCKAQAEARKKGYRCTETTLPDGSIRLTVNA